jgi:hypothetical protein
MAVDIQIRTPTDNDVSYLSENLRQHDEAEVRALTGMAPADILSVAIESGAESWSVLFDGNLVGMWGVMPYRDSAIGLPTGYGWLLTSHWADRYPKTFYRVCRDMLEVLFSRWGAIIGETDRRYRRALRWGERLGFRFEEPRPSGVGGWAFQSFTVRREDLSWLASA